MILVLNAAEGLLQILVLDKSPYAAETYEANEAYGSYAKSPKLTPHLAPNVAESPAVNSKSASILARAEIIAVSQGTEILAPSLQQLFTAHNLEWSSLEGIVCVTGPGSFTGLRLILSTAAALARIRPAKLNKPTKLHEPHKTDNSTQPIKLASLNYLQLLAASLPGSYQGRVRVMTHAKQGLVHTADYLVPSLQELVPPQMLSLDAAYLEANCCLNATAAKATPKADAKAAPKAAAKATSDSAPDFWLGSGIQRNLDLFQNIPREKLLDYPPTLEALARLATGHLAWQTTDLEPMYLRPCDAELNLTT